MSVLIIIFFGEMSDDEKDLIDRVFSKMNIKMYNISLNMLRNKFDAEEAVAQTFLKIIDNIEKISALPCPWIEPYCVIILKNGIRERKKIIHVEDVDYFGHIEGDYDIEEEYLETVNKEQLLSCINRLSDDEKFFVQLRFVNEMKFKDISELLEITEETARKRSQRILKKIRLYYKEGEKSRQYG